MNIFYFTMGFLTALVFIIVLLAAVYYHLVKKQKRRKTIQGYLDLIPDLTETQRRQVRKIRQVFLPNVADIRKNLCLKRSELADILFEEPADRVRIDQVAQQILNYQQALEMDEKRNDMRGKASRLRYIGLVYFKKENWEQALKHYTESLKLSDEIKDLVGKKETLNKLGDMYIAQGDEEKAKEFLKEAEQIIVNQ